MPSPFPGMNPYLEQRSVWHDFHERMCPAIAEAVSQQVRQQFFVRIDEHVYIHELSADEQLFVGRGDVAVHQPKRSERAAVAMVEAPSRVRLPAVDIEQLSFLEIVDKDEQRVVTVIELLSPANKRLGPDREQYIAKRSELLRNWVNFVEIDLLRGGPRQPMELLPECDYCVMVSRWQERPDAGVWPLRLRNPLPTIPIPLEPPYPDALLDLQAVVNRVYDAAGYEDYIYRHEPEPPLDQADHDWAVKIMGSAKAR